MKKKKTAKTSLSSTGSLSAYLVNFIDLLQDLEDLRADLRQEPKDREWSPLEKAWLEEIRQRAIQVLAEIEAISQVMAERGS